uniref:Putative cathepsin L n=1 Tax=Crangon crangon TaxID=491138 RepID=A0A2Z4C107_CRACN|nr:putative cathepsin L [Crangon crangon]
MNLFIICCFLTAVAGNNQWNQFKLAHEKLYSNVKEELYRKSIFEHNQKYVEEHNERFRQGLVTFNLKMNKYGDMTSDEFLTQMTGLNQMRKDSSDAPGSKSPEENLSDSVNWREKGQQNMNPGELYSSLPLRNGSDSVDWREKGAVTPVKNQGMMGWSCVYSTVGSLEGVWFVKNGTLFDMSEQQVIDCSSQYFCEQIYEDIKTIGGMDSEDSYPMQYGQEECQFDPEGVVATVTGYKSIPFGDEEIQAKVVRDIGPINVLIDASNLSFQLYYSGIYYDPNCNPLAVNHALVAVGYGTQGDNDYWILKNSWGSSWGESGFMRIMRNKNNHCGVASQSFYPTV